MPPLLAVVMLAAGVPVIEQAERAAPAARARGWYRPRADSGPPFPEAAAGLHPVTPFVPFKRTFRYEPPKVAVLFLARARPVRIEATFDAGGPAGDRWTKLLRTMFAYGDRDGDGYLNRYEAEHVFSLAEVRQMLAGGTALRTAAAGPLPSIEALDRDGDGRASFDEFAAYYDPLAAGLLSVGPSVVGPDATDVITAELFARLDTNGDGRITAEEFRNAWAALAKLDTDEDECLTAQEILANRLTQPAVSPPPPRNPAGPKPAPPTDVLVMVGPLPGSVVQQMIKKYDTDGDFALSRQEIGFTQADFDRLDTNRDGKLSAAELDAWRAMPADLIVRGKDPSKDSPSPFAVAKGGGFPGGLTLPEPGLDRVLFRFGTQTLDLANADRSGASSDPDPWAEAFEAGNGVVREEDLAKPQFQYLRVVFDCVDRDGDGRVTRKEADRYQAVQREVRTAGQSVAYAARVPNLFGLLDADGDGRISPRELRTAHARLAPFDPAGHGAVTKAVLQPMAVVRVGSRGAPAGGDRAFTGNPGPARTPPTAGPLWFRKMDRNGDGELSRGEFLGTAADFDRIDTDGDGYITAAEAEAFDKAQRKGK